MRASTVIESGEQKKSSYSRRYLLALPLVGALVAVIAYPLKVTVDGFFYLSSARGLWTEQDAELVYWSREVGYVIFLKALNYFFGSGDVMLSALQGVMLSAPIAILVGMTVRVRTIFSKFLIALVVVSTFWVPQYFGYSSLVLKQPLLVAFVGFAAFVAGLSHSVVRARSVIALLSLTVLGAFVAPHVAINMKYLWMWPGLVVPFVIYARRQRLMGLRKRQYGDNKSHRFLGVRILFPLFFSAMIFVIGHVSQGLWDSYKKSNGADSALLVDYGMDESDAIFDRLTRPWTLVTGIKEEVPILMMLVGTDNVGGVKENELFTSIQADPVWRCGAYDAFYMPPYTEFGSYIQGTCRSRVGQGIARSVHGWGSLYYKILMIAAFVAPLVAFARRNWQVATVLSCGVWFGLIYAAYGGYTIDRYGLPIFPFGVAGAVYLVVEAFRLTIVSKSLRTTHSLF